VNVETRGRHRRQAAQGRVRNTMIVLIDHGLSSLTNVLPTIVIARELGVDALGKFAIAFTLYFLILGFVRNYVQETYLIEAARKPSAQLAQYTAQSARACFASGSIAALVGIITFPFLGELSETITPVLLLMPGLLLQDAVRYHAFAEKRPHIAALSDGLWLVTFCLAIPFVHGLVEVTAAWAIAGWIAAIAVLGKGIFSVLRLKGSLAWFIEHKATGGFFALDFTMNESLRQIAIWALALLGSFAAAGEYRAAEVISAPLSVTINALLVAIVPVAARATTPRMAQITLAYIGVCVFLGSAWLVVELLLPAGMGKAIVGDAWPGAKMATIAITAGLTISSVVRGALMVLRIMRAMRRGFLARLCVLPISVVCVVVGAWRWDAAGAAWGLTISMVALAPLLAVQALLVLKNGKLAR
jgi:O-antigen/teichoic acid export membrane protein